MVYKLMCKTQIQLLTIAQLTLAHTPEIFREFKEIQEQYHRHFWAISQKLVCDESNAMKKYWLGLKLAWCKSWQTVKSNLGKTIVALQAVINKLAKYQLIQPKQAILDLWKRQNPQQQLAHLVETERVFSLPRPLLSRP